MECREFAKLFARERSFLVEGYLSQAGQSSVSTMLASMKLDSRQLAIMKEVIYGVVTDCFYSTLLGLDGCASIGGVQTEYTVHDGDGLPLHGDLEAAAFSELQNDTSSPN